MFRWGRGNRRGYCVMVPVRCLMSLLLIVLLCAVDSSWAAAIPSNRAFEINNGDRGGQRW